MDVYDGAAHSWWLEAERVALGYATELAEYAAVHPRPQLRDYMVNLSPVYQHNKGE